MMTMSYRLRLGQKLADSGQKVLVIAHQTQVRSGQKLADLGQKVMMIAHQTQVRM